MTTTTDASPADQAAAFRTAVAAHEDNARERLGAATYADCAASERRWHGGKLRNELLADAVDGLDLDAAEWSLLRWFLGWDTQEVLASIICKAREQGQSDDTPVAGAGRG